MTKKLTTIVAIEMKKNEAKEVVEQGLLYVEDTMINTYTNIMKPLETIKMDLKRQANEDTSSSDDEK